MNRGVGYQLAGVVLPVEGATRAPYLNRRGGKDTLLTQKTEQGTRTDSIENTKPETNMNASPLHVPCHNSS